MHRSEAGEFFMQRITGMRALVNRLTGSVTTLSLPSQRRPQPQVREHRVQGLPPLRLRRLQVRHDDDDDDEDYDVDDDFDDDDNNNTRAGHRVQGPLSVFVAADVARGRRRS